MNTKAPLVEVECNNNSKQLQGKYQIDIELLPTKIILSTIHNSLIIFSIAKHIHFLSTFSSFLKYGKIDTSQKTHTDNNNKICTYTKSHP